MDRLDLQVGFSQLFAWCKVPARRGEAFHKLALEMVW